MKSVLYIIFLITSIISCIKQLSTKSIESALFPFITVIGIGLIMDLIEELKRYRNDLLTNKTKTKIYKNQKFINIEWSEIKVGNLIKVKRNEIIPADLFVICSSNKDNSFFLQTSNLDGESNLKQREVLKSTQKLFYKMKNKEENYLEKMLKGFEENGEENCYIEVEQPNKNIYKINGNFIFNKNNKNYFDVKNTAIRGSILKNTNYIYGIVIYTGNDTKIMKNFIKYKTKFVILDILIDRIVIIIVIIRLVYVMIFMTIGILIRLKYLPDYENNKLKYDYIFYYQKGEKKNNIENIKYFSAHFILSQNLLPTSVVLLLAVTKIIQSLFIEFLEKKLRTKPSQKMKCFSSELLDELGSVKYIFSDKTGTLTQNQTQFKACSIFTSLFDESNDKDQSFTNNINSTNRNASKINLSSNSITNFSSKFKVENLLTRLKLRNTPLDIKNIDNCPFKSQGEAMEEFILNMALNHEIMAEKKNGINSNNNTDDNDNDNIIYQGTNPDEITLVGAAKELGFCFMGKIRNIIKIKRIFFSLNKKEEKNEFKNYEVLLNIPFSSQRQRSTIIVKDLKTNNIKLYIKGSDSQIFKKINSYSKDNIYEITKEHLNIFARRGLRTLCYAFKIISESEWKNWSKEYNEIKASFQKNKELIEKNLIEEIETNCYLLGVSALEDQLQDNVQKDIQQFIEAGINFWMLTGDKMDTAESIGYSIKLFDSDTEVYKIKETNIDDIIERMKKIKLSIKEAQLDLSNLTINNEKKGKMDFNTKVSLFKKKIKDNIEIIYEEKDDEIEKEDKEEQVEKEIIKIKKNSTSRNNLYIENGNDKYKCISTRNVLLNTDTSINNNDNLFINIKKDELFGNIIKKKDTIENMSIFKFMVDNQYFENSNEELEKLSIVKDRVVQPNLKYSNESERDSLENLKENSNNNIVDNKNKSQNEKSIDLQKSENNEEKNTHKEKEYYNYYSDKELYSFKNEIRKKTNLPTSAKEFLDYFEKCVEKSREIFYIQQKSFFLFKLPYLYGPIDVNKDPLTEDLQKNDWKEKLNLKNYLMHTKIKYSLIISGESIQSCISEGEASDLFWFLIEHSRSIICCRCSPIQKCNIVQFVKSRSKEITLAIGDGENDVNMIKAANVGIGIFGKEGNQAAFNSDYAFYEFKYLKILLFEYGRFTLLRNTYFLNMFFSKNIYYSLVGIIFVFFSLYSGTFFYDELYDSMFNTIVSIIPLIVFSVIDEDFDPNYDTHSPLEYKRKMKMTYLLPDMYKQTRDSKPFNVIKYIITTILSFLFAIIIFFIFKASFNGMIKNSNGDIASYYELIFFIYIDIIIIHFSMVYIDTSLFNGLVLIFFVIQVIINVIIYVILDRVPNDNKLNGISSQLFSLNIFLVLIADCFAICLPFYILRRMELFFGLNISNLIKTNDLETIFAGKFYNKKIAQMIRAIGSINKFKRIHKDMANDAHLLNSKYESIIDLNMIKVVKHYEENKKKNK